MHALIADVAVSGVPKPMPVVLETQFVEGPHGRRPQEEIPIYAWRNRTVGFVTDGHAPLEAQTFRHINLADNAALQRLNAVYLESGAAMLRSDLHHALGLARNL